MLNKYVLACYVNVLFDAFMCILVRFIVGKMTNQKLWNDLKYDIEYDMENDVHHFTFDVFNFAN